MKTSIILYLSSLSIIRNSKAVSSFSFTSSAPVPALRSRVEPRTSPEVSPADTRAMTRMRGQWSDSRTFGLLVLADILRGFGGAIFPFSQPDISPCSSMWPVSQPRQKVEALWQTAGEIQYTADLPSRAGELQAAFVLSSRANSTILSVDATEALVRMIHSHWSRSAKTLFSDWLIITHLSQCLNVNL